MSVDDSVLFIKPTSKNLIKLLKLKIAHQKKLITLSEQEAIVGDFLQNKEFIMFKKQFKSAAIDESNCLIYILQLAEIMSDSIIFKRKFKSEEDKMMAFENNMLDYLKQILTLISKEKSIDKIYKTLAFNFDV